MPALRRRANCLLNGGWYNALRDVSASDDLEFSSKWTLSMYDGRPGVRPMVKSEKAMLSRRPLVVAKRKADIVASRKATSINKRVLDETNKSHARLEGWPIFNRWTPAHKYLSKRSQCDFNFSMRNDRSAWLFPERRFVRFINNVNEVDNLIISSSRAVRRSVCSTPVLRDRIKLLSKWSYVIASADYMSLTCERVGRRVSDSRAAGELIALRKALSKKVR
jgi:hypothetical protein